MTMRVIDQHLAHQVGRDREEPCTGMAIGGRLGHHPGVGFVHQGGGLQRVAVAFPAEIRGGQSV